MEVKCLGNTEDYVYDISLDGTFVNALGGNVCKNTDGFNFQIAPKERLRYTDEHPYISSGKGRNSVAGKKYVGVEADVCEFEDLYFHTAWDGGVNKMGLGIDEYCPATINFSRKNYADLLKDGSTKKVGNTIKSRRMSGYIENFLDEGIDYLLKGEGQKFIERYYEYINKIFNYQIPLKDIASKGKIKKSVADYKADCLTTTKSGSKKSRQAWYELVIQNKVDVDINDTIYYINTGTKKSESDVKRITHQFVKWKGEELELNNKIKKEILLHECEKLNRDIKSLSTKENKEIIKKYITKEDDEIILNCQLIPTSIVESDKDVMCNDDIEYNVVKYIDQFNKRITPLLVCFSKDIRDKILVSNPSERQYFTEEQCKLVAGEANKPTDQDTYEQLMTPERKEIEYWLKVGKIPPFVKECNIDWDKLVDEYEKTQELEQNTVFIEENEKYLNIINNLTKSDITAFEEDGTLPSALSNIVSLDTDMRFKFVKLPNMYPSTGGYLFDDIKISDNSEELYESFID